MADLSFIIRADTKELDVAYKKMEQLDKRADELTKKLSSSQPGSKEFAELRKWQSWKINWPRPPERPQKR